MNNLVERAKACAVQPHARINQRLTYNLRPCDAHLKAVADLVASVTDDPETIAAAWLHDIVEDTPTTFEELANEFGAGVTQLVMELTEVSKPSDGNRTARKEIDRRHLALASPRAKTVKLADVIVNCMDIRRHDERFGRVCIAEMLALLEVLHEGDATLYNRAERDVGKCARNLGVSSTATSGEQVNFPDVSPREFDIFNRRPGIRLFTEAFTARDVMAPLISFDEGTSIEEMREACARERLSLAGIRRSGRIAGYLLMEDLASAPQAPPTRCILPRQTVRLEDSLSDVIHVLTCFSYCFVTLDNTVVGVIGRPDIEKPVVRMWLFGMIILIEMTLVEVIRNHMPEGGWQRFVTEGRLEKAKLLLEERRRRNLGGDLLDCLQFSDKLQVAVLELSSPKEMGFSSVSAARKVIKEIESLRNNLAHGQDITSRDWPQIARMTRRLHMLLNS